MDPAQALAAIEFGRFSILPHRRELLAEGQPLDLGGRAFDVLMALIEASGAVVSKDDLIHRVWPDRIVEENSLQAQIAALRRTFGADRDLIRTVAGRGYQFIGEIRTVSASPNAQATAGMLQPTPTPSHPPTNLPEPVSELIGRDVELNEILDLIASHRLLTLAGAGGIGKTRLGFEIARQLLPRFADGVWAIELAPLSDPELVPVAVATALGLELASDTASPLSVANALRSNQLMLVLDNCEHVVDAAARMAEALLRTNPAARVIATSREPLRTEGEWVYPVQPLAVPAEGSPDGEDPLRYGAVRLFVKRARAAAPSFSPDARGMASMAGICRRLDGIPLAIELAAARAATLGIEGLAAGLDDCFRLLTGGRRTALARHQTLRATLDWSYELLTEPERVVLRRLAVFAGGFTLQAASTVVADDEIAAAEVVDCVANLVTKSLVIADSGGERVRFRLLETTRAYALDKLAANGEFEQMARRHLEYYRDLFERIETEWETRPTVEWRAEYTCQIDDARAALAWAFGPGGDAATGVALAVASVPLWLEMSLLSECCGWMQAAIARLDDAAAIASRQEMKLESALGHSLMFTQGMNSRAHAALTRAGELANSLQDVDYQLRALVGHGIFCVRLEDFPGALALGRRAKSIAEGVADPFALSTAESIIGASLMYRGDYADALTYAQRVHRRITPLVRRAHIVRSGIDLSIWARCNEVLILWAQGLPDQSAQIARDVVTDAEVGGHPLSLCLALTWCGCVISLRLGDLEAAERAVNRLKDHAERHGLRRYHGVGLGFEGQLSAKRGDAAAGERPLRTCLDGLTEVPFETHYTAFLSSMAEVLAAVGHRDESLAIADEALRRAERNHGLSWLPEALRIKGEILLLSDRADTTAAEEHFRRSLDLARLQGALSWELRCTTSLARLWRDHARNDEARQLLAPVYDRFTEGFATADLKAAKVLLDDLS
jgi:predicted ATPase/DNA-binding winged helix-turn-helix (wHTH) protein